MPTKAEIEQELKDVKKRNEKLQQELKEQREVTLKMAEKDAGWLITAPNSLYTGTKYGISFINGQAFVRKNQKVPYFRDDMKKMGETELHKFIVNQYPVPPYTTKQQEEFKKEIRDREESMTEAWMAVRAINSDFGYKFTPFAPEDHIKLQKALNERAKQAKAIMQQQEAQSRDDLEKIVKPGYVGETS